MSALDDDEWSDLLFNRLIPGTEPLYSSDRGRVGPRAVPDVMAVTDVSVPGGNQTWPFNL